LLARRRGHQRTWRLIADPPETASDFACSAIMRRHAIMALMWLMQGE